MTDQTLALCAHCGQALPPYAGRGRRRTYHDDCGYLANGRAVPFDLRRGLLGEPGPHDVGRYLDAVKRLDPCAYCGGRGGSLDHIEANGRETRMRDAIPNLAGSCVGCNAQKQRTSLLRYLLTERLRREIEPLARTMALLIGGTTDGRPGYRQGGRARLRPRRTYPRAERQGGGPGHP